MTQVNIPTNLHHLDDVTKWIAANSIPGDTVVLNHSPIREAANPNPLIVRGRTLAQGDPNASVLSSMNDNNATAQLEAKPNASGSLIGAMLRNIPVIGINKSGSRFTEGNEDNHGVLVDFTKPGASMCMVQGGVIDGFFGDGKYGPGGLNGVTIRNIGRHGATLHWDETFMTNCIVYNCSRIFGYETSHRVHNSRITGNVFGGGINGGPGYCTAPMSNWQYNNNRSTAADVVAGLIPELVEILWASRANFTYNVINPANGQGIWICDNRFEMLTDHYLEYSKLPHPTATPAIELMNAQDVHVLRNSIPAIGAFLKKNSCQVTEVGNNNGGTLCTAQVAA